MNTEEIQKIVESAINSHFAEVELSAKLKELDTLRDENKELRTKLSNVDVAIAPEKVEEITEVVEKAVGDKVESIVGEKLAEIVGRVEEIESAITDKERIAKALSSKKPFKAMSRPAKAFTEGADLDVTKALDTIADKLKEAKDKESLEEVTNLLQAFITSSASKIATSASDEDVAELEAYRELGTIEEIEAAVEVLETYAEEVGTFPELTDEEVVVEENVEVDEVNVDEIDMFASKKHNLSSRQKALIAKRKALLSSKKKLNDKKVQLSSKVAKLQQLKEKSQKLNTLKSQIKENMELSSKKEEFAPASLANSLFTRK